MHAIVVSPYRFIGNVDVLLQLGKSNYDYSHVRFVVVNMLIFTLVENVYLLGLYAILHHCVLRAERSQFEILRSSQTGNVGLYSRSSSYNKQTVPVNRIIYIYKV